MTPFYLNNLENCPSQYVLVIIIFCSDTTQYKLIKSDLTRDNNGYKIPCNFEKTDKHDTGHEPVGQWPAAHVPPHAKYLTKHPLENTDL